MIPSGLITISSLQRGRCNQRTSETSPSHFRCCAPPLSLSISLSVCPCVCVCLLRLVGRRRAAVHTQNQFFYSTTVNHLFFRFVSFLFWSMLPILIQQRVVLVCQCRSQFQLDLMAASSNQRRRDVDVVKCWPPTSWKMTNFVVATRRTANVQSLNKRSEREKEIKSTSSLVFFLVLAFLFFSICCVDSFSLGLPARYFL